MTSLIHFIHFIGQMTTSGELPVHRSLYGMLLFIVSCEPFL